MKLNRWVGLRKHGGVGGVGGGEVGWPGERFPSAVPEFSPDQRRPSTAGQQSEEVVTASGSTL